MRQRGVKVGRTHAQLAGNPDIQYSRVNLKLLYNHSVCALALRPGRVPAAKIQGGGCVKDSCWRAVGLCLPWSVLVIVFACMHRVQAAFLPLRYRGGGCVGDGCWRAVGLCSLGLWRP